MTRTNSGFTLWFTGLPSSGKSTLARQVAAVLSERGFKVEVLDGDEVREHLSGGLGFSKADRDTNVRRVGFVARLLSRNGVVAIAALISPYRDTRQEVRLGIDRFVEVWVDCPLEVLQARDVKGLYRKARAGQISHFTGVDDPYEAPDAAEVVIRSSEEPVEASVARIVATLESLGYVSRNL